MSVGRAPSCDDPYQAHPLHFTNTPGGLKESEFFWREHQTFLASCGYKLRPRYNEDWEPSWLKSKNSDMWHCEDGKTTFRSTTMDATRVADGRIVSLKQVNKSFFPTEEDLVCFFSQEPLASDPHNHSVPVYEVLHFPRDEDVIFLVMPHLMRIQECKFATVGEALECFRQVFEGLHFIHSHLIAHCDLHLLNVLMDPAPLFSDIPHPGYPKRSYDFQRKVKKYTRTERPTRYYIIDFGISRKFSPGDALLTRTWIGGDKSVPEYRDPTGVSNPFLIDVYSLGNMIREDFMQHSSSLNFMRPLVADMTREKPEERLSMEQALRRFSELLASLPERTLRARYVYRSEFFVARVFRACRHVVRTAKYVRQGLSALPTPPAISRAPPEFLTKPETHPGTSCHCQPTI
ncbi:hypothetical protein L226DRAFT_514269 [Lentinus tigrinus ALCF2SS1-7]|uniref:Protein kinase domain-containing protein n=1 Tax=Lentinus tigrinus ALCF2SS1-6 TaxID=1328759 RepID=A0A5C2RWV3_9APHY|nr:hypothetical protein L227DRAFT_510068 [Lentinus tigrinus ALCF2SS1-6]RPD70709.1 hypothetical protein L226DRAFT_514269 [Lentinus tigrinus ALCF2SS1-7]